HYIAAGPLATVPKDALLDLLPEFVDGVSVRLGGDRPADAIHANYWLSGVAGHELKHRFDLPLGCTFHTLARVKGVDRADATERAVAEATVMGCSDVVFASCPDEAEQLVRLYDADPMRIEIVPPGVEHAIFAPGSRSGARRAIGADLDRPLVLYVGRIQPLKGLDVAVSAFDLLETRAEFIAVGGPSGPSGESYLASVMRDGVRLVAPQPHELLASYYRAADVVLVPSKSESFGLVALEAAACGTPVVATAVGGLHTLVLDGRTGFLRPRSPESFAAAAELVVGDPALASHMGWEAARHAKRFTWSAAASSVVDVFSRLTERVPVACS
ncbi:MAG: glycosyltransferase, partial [Acidimicrobiales bacterium]